MRTVSVMTTRLLGCYALLIREKLETFLSIKVPYLHDQAVEEDCARTVEYLPLCTA